MKSEQLEFLQKGLDKFRNENYFETHEHWEDAWRTMEGNQRIFWQAMIQLTVGAYHFTKGNLHGCKSMWNKAIQKCELILKGKEPNDSKLIKYLKNNLNVFLKRVEGGGDPMILVRKFAKNPVLKNWFEFE